MLVARLVRARASRTTSGTTRTSSPKSRGRKVHSTASRANQAAKSQGQSTSPIHAPSFSSSARAPRTLTMNAPADPQCASPSGRELGRSPWPVLPGDHRPVRRAGGVPPTARALVPAYFDGKEGIWWGITGLSVSHRLPVPAPGAALYLVLRPPTTSWPFLGTRLVPCGARPCHHLAELCGAHPASAGLRPRRRSPASARGRCSHSAALLDSTMFAAYVILVPLSASALGLVMTRRFSHAAGHTGS